MKTKRPVENRLGEGDSPVLLGRLRKPGPSPAVRRQARSSRPLRPRHRNAPAVSGPRGRQAAALARSGRRIGGGVQGAGQRNAAAAAARPGPGRRAAGDRPGRAAGDETASRLESAPAARGSGNRGGRREGNNMHYRLVDLCVRSLLDQGLCLVEEVSRQGGRTARAFCD